MSVDPSSFAIVVNLAPQDASSSFSHSAISSVDNLNCLGLDTPLRSNVRTTFAVALLLLASADASIPDPLYGLFRTSSAA